MVAPSDIADDPTGSFPDDELQVAVLDRVYMLLQRTRLWTIPVLHSFDLTEPTSQVLWALRPERPAPSMRELAGWLTIDPSSVTFLVDRLESRGLVERRVDSADRRGKRVHLSPQGLELRTQMIAALGGRNPMNQLTTRETRQLLRLLDKASPPSPHQV
ncbi:MAG: putative transcriptional regulator of the MarR family [Thermoleophilia bacterium]|nr:putative transcriptional regulator of the MarR family [Thermoleophilia bacterium]